MTGPLPMLGDVCWVVQILSLSVQLDQERGTGEGLPPGGPPYFLIPGLHANSGFALLLSLYLLMSLLPFPPTLASFLRSVPLLGPIYSETEEDEGGSEGGRAGSGCRRPGPACPLDGWVETRECCIWAIHSCCTNIVGH